MRDVKERQDVKGRGNGLEVCSAQAISQAVKRNVVWNEGDVIFNHES